MFCALALLAEIANTPNGIGLPAVGAVAGLSEMQAWQLIAMNDGHGYRFVGKNAEAVHAHRVHTFAEIADVVAGWFPS